MNWTEEVKYDPEFVISKKINIEISKDEKIKELEDRIKKQEILIFILIHFIILPFCLFYFLSLF